MLQIGPQSPFWISLPEGRSPVGPAAIVAWEALTDPAATQPTSDLSSLAALDALQAELAEWEQQSVGQASAALGALDAAWSGVDQVLESIESALAAATEPGLAPQARAALQQQIDAGLAAIQRITSAPTWNNQRLLDGSTESLTFSWNGGQSSATLELASATAVALADAASSLVELASGGAADLATGRIDLAAEIVRSARHQVLAQRGRLGAFDRYTLGTAGRASDQLQTQRDAPASRIGDADSAQRVSGWIRGRLVARAADQTWWATNARRANLALLLAGLQSGR